MSIRKLSIENFKIFENFELEFDDGINILVGDNEIGKSTVIEAIHLALTGILNGKPLNIELTQYLFNNNVVARYLESIKDGRPQEPPEIRIELFFDEIDEFAHLKGQINKNREDAYGIALVIALTDDSGEYEELLKSKNIKTLPIEYYDAKWSTFADKFITTKGIPIKSALVDSSLARYQNGSDIYISRIVRQGLERTEVVKISQAHRRMREYFMEDGSVKAINEKLQAGASISDKKVALSVELLSKNAWENSLMTYIDEVPFQYIGKGEQCIIKTKLALADKKAKNASVILMEEPENHLTHTRLSQLIESISKQCGRQQIIISTHSSFVANKLGINNLILLGDGRCHAKVSDLTDGTRNFFKKLSGYDTLRLILSKKTILVEGDSDELIVQRAYMDMHNGKLPIEDGIDVISVGTSFLRFLEIADKLKKRVAVVTDNDGNIDALNKKYKDYIGDNKNDHIFISFDKSDHTPNDDSRIVTYNYNTLENLLLSVNSLKDLNAVFSTLHESDDKLRTYMKSHKTECALAIFEFENKINYPDYILEAIKHVCEQTDCGCRRFGQNIVDYQ
ncbi:ATP-dependent endonuclease [Deltaproteobacteria bacterium]|nr:ATP-dependent endonuclease [Deltaproteobacteria bacterium]